MANNIDKVSTLVIRSNVWKINDKSTKLHTWRTCNNALLLSKSNLSRKSFATPVRVASHGDFDENLYPSEQPTVSRWSSCRSFCGSFLIVSGPKVARQKIVTWSEWSAASLLLFFSLSLVLSLARDLACGAACPECRKRDPWIIVFAAGRETGQKRRA